MTDVFGGTLNLIQLNLESINLSNFYNFDPVYGSHQDNRAEVLGKL